MRQLQDFLYSLPYDCYSTVMGGVYGLCNFLDNSGHTLLSQLGAAVEGTAEAIYSSDNATMTTEMEHRGLLVLISRLVLQEHDAWAATSTHSQTYRYM